MAPGMTTVICPVKDLTQAKALRGALPGTDPCVDEPCYAGFRTDVTGPAQSPAAAR